MGYSKSISKREVYSYISLPQETGNISNNLTLHLKQLEKEEQNPPKVSRRKEIIKIRSKVLFALDFRPGKNMTRPCKILLSLISEER